MGPGTGFWGMLEAEDGTVAAALPELRRDPADQACLTLVRRAFHTLKGSARMAGAIAAGNAADVHKHALLAVARASTSAQATSTSIEGSVKGK